MKNYDYITARTITKEGCERTINKALDWLVIDNAFKVATDLADIDRAYINTDLSDYSNALEGWC